MLAGRDFYGPLQSAFEILRYMIFVNNQIRHDWNNFFRSRRKKEEWNFRKLFWHHKINWRQLFFYSAFDVIKLMLVWKTQKYAKICLP